MLNHCYASEQVMRALAHRLGRDEEKWGITGLLHDLDVELVQADPKRHGLETARILEEYGFDDDMIDAIKMHNEEATGLERNTEFQHALAAGETITGMIVATALVYPDKKLASVKPKSITKRMKQKAFAASVKREHIKECEMIGIPLNEFAELSLKAMKKISDQLGL
jgi:putative nucleotidyltransferase with HDIG domain